MIRLFAVDLDGTLLDDNRQISEDNMAALEAAKNAGVEVAICSGRGFPGFKAMLDRLGERCLGRYHFGLNGGMIFDRELEQIEESSPIGEKKVLEILRIGKQFPDEVNIHLYTPTEILVERRTPSSPVYEQMNLCRLRTVPELEAYAAQAIKLIFVLHENEELKTTEKILRFGEKVCPLLPEGITGCHSCTYLFEIFSNSNSKAVGLQKLARLYGLTREEVMAIGDNQNDLPMLRVAGTSVAVANADPDTKATATFETEADNNHSAVAEAVRRFIYFE